ncbi:NAD(+) synthase [Candidatus Microgenomates bacterium]|nr:NAD(+) synthase [Candidatus Microgenomates bacterium]
MNDNIYKALTVGTRNFVHKNGFHKVVFGLSGGIDSSVTAIIAVDALGNNNVLGVIMPSPYTQKTSINDARKIAKNLGIKTLYLPIKSIMKIYNKTLAKTFSSYPEDVTEENLQARIRCTLLMALSNKFQMMLLATGNKSELATGYCTLYGDLAGALAPIGDLLKTQVYSLARWLNKEKNDIIPLSTLEKEPSAELKTGQKDSDILPPYEILDEILEKYLRWGKTVDAISKEGFDRETVMKVIEMVKRSAFKRKQAPPSLKVSDWPLEK